MSIRSELVEAVHVKLIDAANAVGGRGWTGGGVRPRRGVNELSRHIVQPSHLLPHIVQIAAMQHLILSVIKGILRASERHLVPHAVAGRVTRHRRSPEHGDTRVRGAQPLQQLCQPLSM